MRAYVVATDRRIAPFGDRAADLPVGGWSSLTQWQNHLLNLFGIERVDVEAADQVPSTAEPKLVFEGDVFFTRRVLKSFLKRWRAGGYRAAQLALPVDSTFIRCFDALQDFGRTDQHALFDFWGVPASTSFRRTEVEPLPVIYRERVLKMPVPPQITKLPYWEHPITSSICLHVRHWLHVLHMNRLAVQIRWVDLVVRNPLWASYVLVRGLVFGRGSLLWRVLGSANRIGRGVDIHPTARIEGSVIGDGARIGAHALVRCSIIGAHATVEERATINYSVMADRTYVSKYTLVYSSATMEEANVGASMQMCLMGRRSATTPRTTPTDVLPGQTVKVKAGEQVLDSGLVILGPVIGHDCFIGADTYIAPGRSVPNGTKVGPRPERILTQLPDTVDPTKRYIVVDGKLTEAE